MVRVIIVPQAAEKLAGHLASLLKKQETFSFHDMCRSAEVVFNRSYYGWGRAAAVDDGVCFRCGKIKPLFLFGEVRITVPGKPVANEVVERCADNPEAVSFRKNTEGQWCEADPVIVIEVSLCAECLDQQEACSSLPSSCIFA